MRNKQVVEHLTVTGFASDRKNPLSSNRKNGGKKLKDAKKDDLSNELDRALLKLKEESAEKISLIETKIAGLNIKVKTANLELGQIYQNQMDELEHAKRTLISKLDEYKEVGEDEWKSFKSEFNYNLKGLENELNDLMTNFKNE